MPSFIRIYRNRDEDHGFHPQIQMANIYDKFPTDLSIHDIRPIDPPSHEGLSV